MCSVAGVAIGATVGSSLIGAYDSHEEGKRASASALENAKLADLLATDALRRGAFEAGVARMQGTQEQSAQKAAIAASGIDPGAGTAAAVQATTSIWSRIDAETIRNNAYREALGYRIEAENLRSYASQARRAGNLGMVASILGGAARGGGMAYDWFQRTKNTRG
jgi:hypothetical protein